MENMDIKSILITLLLIACEEKETTDLETTVIDNNQDGYSTLMVIVMITMQAYPTATEVYDCIDNDCGG